MDGKEQHEQENLNQEASSIANDDITNVNGDDANEHTSDANDLAIETAEKEGDIKLEVLEKLCNEYKDKFLRSEAEHQNYIKRTHREMDTIRKYAVESFAVEILTVYDGLGDGFKLLDQNKDSVPEKLMEGYGMTLKSFDKLLEKLSIKEINPIGEKFNPDFHQAVEMDEKNQEYKPGIVCEVLQSGFTMQERLLRPAMVRVKK